MFTAKLLNKLLLTTVCISLIFVFFYKLGSVPNGLYVDEATTGYNSYSLLKTGKDEYGKPYPIAMRFFGSYSPPLYTYLTAISIKLFGLSIFSVRFISALSALLNAYLIYFFSKNLKIGKNKNFYLLSVFLFGISPWVVLLSRVGYETYFGFSLFMLGSYFLFLSIKHSKYLPVAAIILALSLYGSHTQKYLLPIFLPPFYLAFRSKLNYKKNYKLFILSALLGLVISLPLLSLTNTQAFLSKNELFYSGLINTRANSYLLPKILGIPVAFLYEFFARYFAYLSPKSLFFLPDPDPQRSLPALSVFYSWMLIPYLIGIYIVVRNHSRVYAKYILLLLLASPIPAALANDPFSTQRALPVFLPIFLIILIGINKLLTKNILVKIALFAAIFIYSPLMLYRSYFVLLPAQRATAWGYGYEQLTDIITSEPKTNFVIDTSRLKPIYIEYAFFAKYDPKLMHQNYSDKYIKNYYNQVDTDPPTRLGNVEFRPIIWESDICKKQILVGDNLSFSENNIAEHFLEKEFEIKDPWGELILQGVKTTPERKCRD